MKSRGWLLVLGIAVTFALGIVASQAVEAETEIDLNPLLTKINEKNKGKISMETEGRIDFEIENLASGFLELDFRYDSEPDVEIEGNFWLLGEVAKNGPEGSTEIKPVENYGPIRIVDGLAYFFNGYIWTVRDVTETITMLETQKERLGIATPNITTPEQMEIYHAFVQQYYEVNETETEYIFQLKENINREQFWKDAQKFHNSLLESKNQQNESEIISAEKWSDLEKEVYFLILENIETGYSKENFYLSSLNLELNATDDDIEVFADFFDITDRVELAKSNELKLELNFTFYNPGVEVEIEIPENAIEYEKIEEPVSIIPNFYN